MNIRITPLRYPGGKQKITPFIKEIIQSNNLYGCSYIEPYAGGAGVGLSLLVNNIVNNIYINDISKNIYAFWYSVINNTERFVLKIRDIPLNIEEWNKQHLIFKSNSDNLFDLGFATFFMLGVIRYISSILFMLAPVLVYTMIILAITMRDVEI